MFLTVPWGYHPAGVFSTETVTIFFTNMLGFVDYTERFGDEAGLRTFREYDAIVRGHVEAYGGDVVKTRADGLMVAFKATRHAILCAIAIQRAIAEANRKWPDTRVAIAIGIDTGEPIRQDDGDYIGGTVNLAAGICRAAESGKILIAESTRYVAGRIELRRPDGGIVEYVDCGPQLLYGFPEPKRLFEVVWHQA